MRERKELYSRPMRVAATVRVALTFVGCLVGAGFLSGQELWQFFGSKGVWSFAGLALALLLIAACGAVILSFAIASDEVRMDRIIVWFDCPWLRALVALFEGLFLFMVYLLNVAAVGSLVAQIFGLSVFVGGLVFCVVCTALSVAGVTGLARVLSGLMPVLIAVTAALACVSVATGDGMRFPVVKIDGLVSGNWLLDGFIYTTFCMFCAIPVLVPLQKSVPSARLGRRGILIGGLLFGVLAVLILLALATDPQVTDTALPMLTLAFSKSGLIGFFYAVLLIFGILSSGISSQSALNEYFTQRLPRARRFLLPASALMSLLAFLLGLLGFERLVGILYPLFGYIGVLPLLLLLLHAVLFYRQKKSRNKKRRI
ncbi:MAG: hypothetical protein IJA78_00595 [Clostridia bacterium]|nr:hypothetical protein [Clostridia bacterium]